jgi:ribosomal protein S8
MKKYIKTKKILILILLFTSSSTIIWLPINIFADDDYIIEFKAGEKDKSNEEIKDWEIELVLEKSQNNNIKNEKKILKKEIQKRKKLHKTLLESYNTNFDKEILSSITNNWLILNSLKNKYYTYFENKEITTI